MAKVQKYKSIQIAPIFASSSATGNLRQLARNRCLSEVFTYKSTRAIIALFFHQGKMLTTAD